MLHLEVKIFLARVDLLKNNKEIHNMYLHETTNRSEIGRKFDVKLNYLGSFNE